MDVVVVPANASGPHFEKTYFRERGAKESPFLDSCRAGLNGQSRGRLGVKIPLAGGSCQL